jgi:DNA-binding CsgD family transcriptional regulator
MNQFDRTDVRAFARKLPGRRKSLWRIPVIAATAAAGLTVVSIALDAGNERARDLALLIGAPTLYLLLPATASCFVVALVRQIHRRRIVYSESTSDRVVPLDRALAQATAPTALRARALLLSGHLTVGQGDPAGVHLLDEGEALAERLNAAGELAYATYLRGVSAMFRAGDLPAAITLFDRALAALPTTSGPASELRLQLLLTLGTAVGLVGDRPRAAACEQEVLRLTQPWDSGFYRALAIWGPALAAWQSRDLDTAAALVSVPLHLQQRLRFDDRYTIGQSLEVMAWIAAAARRPRRAATLLGAAKAFWADVGSSIAAHRHFEGHHEDCWRRTSDVLGENAFHAAVKHGAGLTAEQAVAFALDEQPAAGPDAREAAVLSRRERQVAELIAQGLSNKEIAGRLVIADRTVESHVEHILAKLGFARRTQVAAWIAVNRRASD